MTFGLNFKVRDSMFSITSKAHTKSIFDYLIVEKFSIFKCPDNFVVL